jgi:hypothetical protein
MPMTPNLSGGDDTGNTQCADRYRMDLVVFTGQDLELQSYAVVSVVANLFVTD